MEKLETLREAPVQQPALRRAHLLVGGLPQQVVREVVIGLQLAEDPAPPELVDGTNDRIGLQVTGFDEQLEGEVTADSSRQPGNLAGGLGRLLQTALEHLRHGDRSRPVARPCPCPDSFDHVERKPAGRLLQQVDVLLRQRSAGECRRKAGYADVVERAQRELGQQARCAHPDHPAGHVGIFVKVVIATRGGHHHRRTRAEAQEKRDERKGLLVAPLHVVQHQKQRPVHREENPTQTFEEAVALPRVDHRPGGGLSGGAIDRWRQPLDLRAPDRIQRRRCRLNSGSAEPISHRGKGEAPSRSEALRRADHGPLRARGLGHVGDQARLAYAGTSAHHRQGRLTGCCRLPQGLQESVFPLAADQR